ncbi:hypothetical protein T4B_11502, partial [Trichinella pseudospiralis]
MIKHRYGDRYLHNEALEIGFRRLDLSEDLLMAINKNRINHKLESCAKISKPNMLYLWNKWRLQLLQCLMPYLNAEESRPSKTLLKRN